MMKKNQIDYLYRILFITPVAILLAIFVLYPFLSSIYYSLTDWNGISKPNFIGLKNYKDLFEDTIFIQSLKNIFMLTFAGILIMNPLSLILAMLLCSKVIKGRTLLRTIFYIPTIISLVVISNIWVIILAYDGILNNLLLWLNLEGLTTDWLGDYDKTIWVLLFIIIWQGMGNSIVFYMAGLGSIPAELNEAGDLDGVTLWTKFRHITVPLLMPTVTIVSFFQISGMLKLFDLPFIMTKGGPGNATLTPTMLIYNQAFQFNAAGYATTTGVVLMFIIIIISFVQLKLTRSREVEY
ncbi:sugar ABC transporter permease [Paenibacillus psychroresistens]|uniref:Sugar ABC transporter permease n=1 Tax=Paenibacillus psychroresistens TaxID=1778678 RepID=A0A6B8RSH8_9BACL|nr:sugar ABC transporter permease [Paenibacillus psychroresistens]QGQ98774.1 sugar ABC transporter permease [Paenibacillus psychroresistens]